MSNIIDSIKVSGTVYTLSAETSGGGNPTVELTQAQYDALVTAGTVAQDTYYIITDASAGDLTQYWTSAQTNSAITQATSGKVDTSTYTAYTAATDTALSNKQTTISAGTNISVTTGETADTINCTLNLVNGGGTDSVKMKNTQSSNGSNSFAIGSDGVKASGLGSFGGGSYSVASGIFSMAFGRYSITNNYGEVALGFFGKSNGSSNAPSQSSGNTLFSLGNGTNVYGGQHNAFEVRQNGDIYITLNDQDVKLQDQLGGGGSSYSAGTGIDITNNVISVSGVVETSAITTSITSSSTDAQVPSAKAVYDAIGDIETLLSQI